ncbi:IclR family transcriptional regulator [Saccharomonospora azurea]|uniref:Transcriptional regulator n=1 Tax=Saccharomonospora azurea NA-128 TaxID=882081 RepID=H8GCC6_9PSEU|nr:IclR family transcriptional regulator [Saccharomonospora azurea]EHK87020.1 transcriptional regulator, IclR family protein [Saccharomonospora azurea SZMC 14600]EHY88760.1 transcriptional regulator [Saccharomonospora azurea NA-128]
MRNSEAEKGAGPVQSVDRAISVLELLAREGEAGITEIATELGVHKSTASRLVGALEARNLVEQLGPRGKYAIGFGIVRLAGSAMGRLDLARLGHDACSALADTLGETVNIAVSDDGVAINVSQAFGAASVTARNWTGRRTPLHATSSGKVLLAYLPESVRESLLGRPLERYTAHTTVEAGSLRAELDRIRRDGYAASFEELEVGMHAIAVPVFGADGRAIAAMSASGPAYRFPRERVPRLVTQLTDAAAELSSQLGHFPR